MDLTHFIDPASGHSLKLEGNELVAPGTRFPIQNGIPRFVAGPGYSEPFGLQWNEFARTQCDSASGVPVTRDRLEAALQRPLSELRGLRVLEAGAGAGRFTEVLLAHGAQVWAFDLSDAVSANFRNNMPHPALTLFQGDIERIPFADGFFDMVVCLGVLQHTPSTRRSLESLTRVIRPGGTLVCDHYRFHRGMFTSLYLVYWSIIRRLNPRFQLQVTDRLTRWFFPLHWHLRDHSWLQVALRRISPINFYYGRFPLSKEQHFEWSRLDTHDRNTDYYKRHFTLRQFERLVHRLGYVQVSVRKGGTGLVCTAIRG